MAKQQSQPNILQDPNNAINASQDLNNNANIPRDPHNGTSSQSNIDGQNTSPPRDENMVIQPEVMFEEHFSNPVNVQMTDCLLEKHGEEILAHVIDKGVKLPSGVDLSKYGSSTPNVPQGSHNVPGSSYIPNVLP